MNGDDIGKFAFELYNKSNSGTLSRDEMKEVLIKMSGNNHHNVDDKVRSAFELMAHRNPDFIYKNEFVSKVKGLSTLLFPIFATQDKLRECILGKSFWKKMEEKAIKYVLILDIIVYL